VAPVKDRWASSRKISPFTSGNSLDDIVPSSLLAVSPRSLLLDRCTCVTSYH
jgi:hypothetical protein